MLHGYIVIDFCNDGKHDPYAFATQKEAIEQFKECVLSYNGYLSDKDIQLAIKNGYYSDKNNNIVLIEKLNKTHVTPF